MQSGSAPALNAVAAQPRLVIYVGNESPLVAAALAPLGDGVSIREEPRVASVLVLVAQQHPHAVIIDLTTRDDARQLLVAALASARHPTRIIILARREQISECLRLPGVYCVISYPLLPAQIRAAIADRRARRRNNQPPQEPPPESAENRSAPESAAPVRSMADFKPAELARRRERWPGLRLYMLGSNRFMAVVSMLYKNAAFALLACLFAAFCFYGFLIGYYLLASGWGAPTTLSRGSDLVEKTITTVADLQAALSINDQRTSEAERDARKADSDFTDAKVLVDYMNAAVDAEIRARGQQAKLSEVATDRARKVLKGFESISGPGLIADSKSLYDRRLITRKSYESRIVGSLESSSRIAALRTEADAADSEAGKLNASIAVLKELRAQMRDQRGGPLATGNTDLITFAREALASRSSLAQAVSQLASAEERKKLLADNDKVLRQRISELEQSAAGRARNGRVNVIFVPYGNERSFTPGAPLYSCALTVVICHRSGAVGNRLPGEALTVHPFFGKPLRGFFVEANLTDQAAATKEIIHAGRAPFFF